MKILANGVNGLRTFLSEVKVELLKCSWPGRQELFGSAVVVIVSIILLGAFVWLCDLVSRGVQGWILR